jgi:hypothetical protein
MVNEIQFTLNYQYYSIYYGDEFVYFVVSAEWNTDLSVFFMRNDRRLVDIVNYVL